MRKMSSGGGPLKAITPSVGGGGSKMAAYKNVNLYKPGKAALGAGKALSRARVK